MNPQEIEQTAKQLEQEAASGKQDALNRLGQELHNMSPDERLAIAKRIGQDQRQQPSPPLVKMEFTDTGDLTFVDTQNAADTERQHRAYNPTTGQLRSVDTEHRVYDSATGKLLTRDRTDRDAGGQLEGQLHEEYSPVTGKRVSEEWTSMNTYGKVHSTRLTTFDPVSGRAKSMHTQNADGSTKDDDMDAGESHAHHVNPDGSWQNEHWKYDKTTNKPLSYSEVHSDGSRDDETWKYDPRTKMQTSHDITHSRPALPGVPGSEGVQIKSTEQELDDPQTGKRKSVHKVNEDGSTVDIRYDSKTGKPISEDHQGTDGSTQHWDYDPNTGKRK